MIEHPDVPGDSNEGFLYGGYGGRCRHFPKREPYLVPTPDALSRFPNGVIVEVGGNPPIRHFFLKRGYV